MLSYKTESKRLVSTFLSYRNDIDIYTEDGEGNKEFYRVLFSRLITSDIKINDITPLGTKNEVIALCKVEPTNGRRKLFIVDGDVAIVHGRLLSLPNLYILNGYCIENFLVDKNSICQFVYLKCGTKSLEAINESIEYGKWLEAYSESFINLFIHFAILSLHGELYRLGNAHKYHRKHRDKILFDSTLIQPDIELLKEQIVKKIGSSKYEQEYKNLKEKWAPTIDNLLTVVSGKDYLIPIVLIKTGEFKKSKAIPSIEEVKICLVQHCNLDRLKDLKEVIEQ